MMTVALACACFALLTTGEQQAKELSEKWKSGPWFFRVLNFLFATLSFASFLKLIHYIVEFNQW